MSEPLPDWPDQPDAPLDIVVDEIRAYWKTKGVADAAVRVFSDPLDPFTPEQVKAMLVSPWLKLLNQYDIPTLKSLICDDYASGCQWMARVIYVKAGNENKPAVFYIAYNKVNLEEHEVLGCMWRNPNRSLTVAFFEPQANVVVYPFAQDALKLIELTAEEIASATDIRY